MNLKKQNPNHSEMKEAYLAIKNNELDRLARYVETYGANAAYEEGTLLHQAIFQNKVDAVNYLLNAAADPNALYDDTTTPLIAAIDDKRWNIARLLVEKGADVNLKDRYNNSPLSKALFHYDGDSSFLEMLISRGADPYQNLLNGYTPMNLAKTMKLANTVQLLMDKHQQKIATRDDDLMHKK